jgi:hypothetical protein
MTSFSAKEVPHDEHGDKACAHECSSGDHGTR